GRKLGAKFIAKLNEVAVNGAVPDITFLLDVPLEMGMKRRHASEKTNDRLDMQQQDFYDRVYKGYETLAKTNGGRYFIIDAKKSIEKVATEVWKIVGKKIKKHFTNE
ncbi:MAG: Thymidylate kinase, partial [uncultured bacterium]